MVPVNVIWLIVGVLGAGYSFWRLNVTRRKIANLIVGNKSGLDINEYLMELVRKCVKLAVVILLAGLVLGMGAGSMLYQLAP